ncbi:MAG: phospho-N-acetylmuramoyl-pentapeptide-transferase [Oscillospiraceae bacterium]
MQMQIIGGVVSFLIAIICGIIFIPMLRKLKFGQEIREEGPAWHASKSGTPTMGGFIFIVAIVLAFPICYLLRDSLNYGGGNTFDVIMLIIVSLGFGVIGFIDDYIKVVQKRNLGLTAKQKFSLQFLVALGFAVWVAFGTGVGTYIDIPFINDSLDLGIFYLPFIVIVILATVNSVNLTDGLDGLATSITIVIAIFFMILSDELKNPGIAFFAATLIGSLAGFLIYNWKPAKAFMGDTGSLFLGGAVCGIAILLKQPLTLLIVGFVYVMESLSVIMQVASFKLTGKRIFKMSPIHHHFEMCGWNEVTVVAVFTGVTVVLCAIMYFLA